MKAQDRSLKREGAVSISCIKGPFPASISVPSTEHSGRLPPAQGSRLPQPSTHSDRSPLGGWRGGRKRQPVVSSIRARPRLSPHFCEYSILLPQPPKQAWTPEVGVGGVAGDEVQGPSLQCPACLQAAICQVFSPQAKEGLVFWKRCWAHTLFNSVPLCLPFSRFCDQQRERMTPGLTAVLRQALESQCHRPCAHKNRQGTQEVI